MDPDPLTIFPDTDVRHGRVHRAREAVRRLILDMLEELARVNVNCSARGDGLRCARRYRHEGLHGCRVDGGTWDWWA